MTTHAIGNVVIGFLAIVMGFLAYTLCTAPAIKKRDRERREAEVRQMVEKVLREREKP